MRYVAKIHVLDVMDQVVVSGYVHEQDAVGGWSPDVLEFSWQVPGVGADNATWWLEDALKRALMLHVPPAPAG